MTTNLTVVVDDEDLLLLLNVVTKDKGLLRHLISRPLLLHKHQKTRPPLLSHGGNLRRSGTTTCISHGGDLRRFGTMTHGGCNRPQALVDVALPLITVERRRRGSV
uniref:Uncharacterized protein n=1 Tax=Aegilops tauschii TaxID=37682 RepID=M8C8Q4_AEGTA